MTFLNRLFGHEDKGAPDKPIDDKRLKDILTDAKRENKEALKSLSHTVDRQIRDAELARQIIDDMLSRANKRKVTKLRKAT